MPNAWGARVEVMMEVQASAEEVQAVKVVFSEAGIEADVDAGFERKGVGDFPWVVYLTLPVGLFLKSFLDAAGKDAYAAVKRLFIGLYAARQHGDGSRRGGVIIIDTGSRQRLLLDDNVPDEAWKRLFETELTETESGHLRWDPRTRSWRDVWEIDIASQRRGPE